MWMIYDLIDTERWDEIRRKLKSNKAVHMFRSSEPDKAGEPFHALCANSLAPPDLIYSVARLDEDFLTTWDFTCDPPALPLHVACDTGSARAVKTLLHIRSDRLYQKVTNEEDENAAIEMRKFVFEKDRGGRAPICLTWLSRVSPVYSNYDNEREPAEEVEERIEELFHVSSLDDMTEWMRETWSKTQSLLYAGSTGLFDIGPLQSGKQWYVLHEIARSGKLECPTIVLWFALKIYRNHASLKNEAGELPLHIAASSPSLARLSEEKYFAGLTKRTQSILEETEESALAMLVNSYPQGARQLNGAGRLPLHLAAERNAKWDGELEVLYGAAPRAIDTRDTKTHLYPFMLAAVKDEDDECENRDLSLDSIYMLLRLSPINVSSGIVKSAYEIYLESKVLEYRKEVNEVVEERNHMSSRVVSLETEIAELKSNKKRRKLPA